MTNDPKSMDWAFWFYWIMATAIGWMVGEMFFNGIPVIVSGVAISILQGIVLYQRIPKPWRWSAVSALGWILGFILHLIIFSTSTGDLVGPMIGATVGISQWLILRNEFDWAGWWIIICILAWSTGLTTIPGLISSGSLPGALTGITLVILFRFSSPPKQSIKGK